MIQRKWILLSLFINGFLMAGCASVNSVSLTPIPSQKGKVVKAEVSKWVILGLTFDNDFIEPLVDDLKKQCGNGVISGILTKDETISYLFLYKHNVVATGFCGQASASARKSSSRNPADSDDSDEGIE